MSNLNFVYVKKSEIILIEREVNDHICIHVKYGPAVKVYKVSYEDTNKKLNEIFKKIKFQKLKKY